MPTYSGGGAVPSYHTVAPTGYWQRPLHAIIAGAVKDGIIAKVPDREIAPLIPMPRLAQFGSDVPVELKSRSKQSDATALPAQA